MFISAKTDVARRPWHQELERLFREHYQMLYRTAYSILHNAADAEDVPQTIFVRLLRSGMPPDMPRNPAGYLYRAALNESLTIVRSRKYRSRTLIDESFERPREVFPTDDIEEARRRVAEMLAELDPKAAEILILRYLHDYSDAEIAKLLGTSRGVIAVRLVRLRARLRKFMKASTGEKR